MTIFLFQVQVGVKGAHGCKNSPSLSWTVEFVDAECEYLQPNSSVWCRHFMVTLLSSQIKFACRFKDMCPRGCISRVVLP